MANKASSRRLIRILAAAVGFAAAYAAAGAAMAAPRAVCDVRDFGAKGDGAALDTKAIQAAIDSCAGKGGGEVYFGPGRYVSGTLLLKSHLTFHLTEGAALVGSHDIKDYLPNSAARQGHTYGTDLAGEGVLTGLLVAHDVTDVTLEGPGVIDGQSDAFMSQTIHAPQHYDPQAVRNPAAFDAAMHDPAYGPMKPVATGRPGVMILIFHAKDITLHNIRLRDSPNWTLVLQDVERATISDFSIIDNPLMPNNDGIDCMTCRDVHISSGTIRTGDDDVVLVNSQDVTVSGLSLASRSAAVRLESTQRAVLSGLTIDSNRGLAIFASRQITRPTDGVLFSNIVMRTHLIPGDWWGKGEPIYISAQTCNDACAGGVRNVVFSNIEMDAQAGIIMTGVPGVPVDGVELRDIRLRMIAPEQTLANAVGGNFDRRWTATSIKDGIVRHDIPAISCEQVGDLTLRNVEIDWSPGLPSYTSGAVACAGFNRLVIDGLSETGQPPSRSSLLLSNGKEIVLQRSNIAGSIKKERVGETKF